MLVFLLFFCINEKKNTACSTSLNTFIAAPNLAWEWRSETLKDKYESVINSTVSDSYPAWYKNCKTINCHRLAKVWAPALQAFSQAIKINNLFPTNKWFLYFEDDAILHSACKRYCLPEPVEKACHFVSLDCRGSQYIHPYTQRGNYFLSASTIGHGTAGFWFTSKFAQYMIDIANDRETPIDLAIFETAKETKFVCWIDCKKNKCVVMHNNDKRKRVYFTKK